MSQTTPSCDGPVEPAPKLRLVRALSPSDAELVVAARAGDESACEMLFRRHHRKVAGLALRLLGRDDEVDDVVQDTFVEALDSLEQLNTPQAFRSWICSIVVTHVAKCWRHRSLMQRLRVAPKSPLQIAVLSETCPPEVAAELRAVHRLIEELPPSVRMVLLLRRVEGLTNDEVAEYMNLSVATVKRRLVEAEERLGRFREAER